MKKEQLQGGILARQRKSVRPKTGDPSGEQDPRTSDSMRKEKYTIKRDEKSSLSIESTQDSYSYGGHCPPSLI
jgi:hypothetical protein